VPTQLPVK